MLEIKKDKTTDKFSKYPLIQAFYNDADSFHSDRFKEMYEELITLRDSKQSSDKALLDEILWPAAKSWNNSVLGQACLKLKTNYSPGFTDFLDLISSISISNLPFIFDY